METDTDTDESKIMLCNLIQQHFEFCIQYTCNEFVSFSTYYTKQERNIHFYKACDTACDKEGVEESAERKKSDAAIFE